MVSVGAVVTDGVEPETDAGEVVVDETTDVVGDREAVGATVVLGATVVEVVAGTVVVVVVDVVVVVVVVDVGPEICVTTFEFAEPTQTLLSTISVTTGREPTVGLVALTVPVAASMIETKALLKFVAQIDSPSYLRLEMLAPPWLMLLITAPVDELMRVTFAVPVEPTQMSPLAEMMLVGFELVVEYPRIDPVDGSIRATFDPVKTEAHNVVPSWCNAEMFEFERVMVRVTVAVDISISVTVLAPLAETNKCPSAIIAIPGLAPTGIVEPTSAPVDGLNR